MLIFNTLYSVFARFQVYYLRTYYQKFDRIACNSLIFSFRENEKEYEYDLLS